MIWHDKTEDIDKISLAYDVMSRAMSPFAKLLLPLLKLVCQLRTLLLLCVTAKETRKPSYR